MTQQEQQIVEDASERVEHILHGADPRRAGSSPIIVNKGETLVSAIGRARKRRSDAGTSKPKKEPAVPNGSLSKQQVIELRDLIQSFNDARDAAAEMISRRNRAEDALQRFMDDITAKP